MSNGKKGNSDRSPDVDVDIGRREVVIIQDGYQPTTSELDDNNPPSGQPDSSDEPDTSE